jgi:hypothetical protein
MIKVLLCLLQAIELLVERIGEATASSTAPEVEALPEEDPSVVLGSNLTDLTSEPRVSYPAVDPPAEPSGHDEPHYVVQDTPEDSESPNFVGDRKGPEAGEIVEGSALVGTGQVLGAGADGKPGSLKKNPPARNRPCVCGSGRKYKNCCGAAKAAATRRKMAELEGVPDKGIEGAEVGIENLFI